MVNVLCRRLEKIGGTADPPIKTLFRVRSKRRTPQAGICAI
jgi:hypothetical protein